MSARLHLTLLATAAWLAGCGGGGNGGGAGDVTQPQVNAEEFRTQEYRSMGGHDAVSLAAGYAIRATGKAGGEGVRIAIVDTGVTPHPDLDIVDAFARFGLPTRDPGPHGTGVAGVAAARKNDKGVHGVAYNAGIVNFRISPEDYEQGIYEIDDDAVIASAIASAAGVDKTYRLWDGTKLGSLPEGESDVINMSFTTPDFEDQIRDAMVRAAGRNKIMTAALGNEDALSPLSAPAIYANKSGIAGYAIAVGALDPTGEAKADFSTSCGTVRRYCLFAPGEEIRSTSNGKKYTTYSGTSFAAPYVAGGAAVLLAAFPERTPQQIVERMLSTADDLGAPGVDVVYGRGRLNMQRALNPVGFTSVALGARPGENSAALAGTSVRLPAWADGQALAAGLGEVLVHDSQLFPFRADIGHSVRLADGDARLEPFLFASTLETGEFVTESGHSLTFSHDPARAAEGLSHRFDELDDDGAIERYRIGFALGDDTRLSVGRGAGAGTGHGDELRALAGGDVAVLDRALSPYGEMVSMDETLRLDTALDDATRLEFTVGRGDTGTEGGEGRLGSVTLSRAFGDMFRLSSTAGVLDEDDTALGTQVSGAAGATQARTSFFSFLASAQLDSDLALFGSFTSGWTDSDAGRPGLVRGLDIGRSDAFAVGLALRELAGDDQLAFSLSQPLRPEDAAMSLDVPVGESADGAVLRERGKVDISPDGRERSLQMVYRRAFDEHHMNVSVGAFARFEPNHDADADTELGGGVRVGYGF
ncbi:MAG: S8 family serine peptidase [Geminicoccaceae bacterium]